ncbi:DUF354 domain-containing protein [Marinobacter salarius]|uniref:DUF354 domain-containing protein n=1 Tax=Marinobacter salarius TaxID=1420917 RepID=UPI003D9C0FE7
MRVLVDIGHAAHVHLFRNLIKRLENSGHHVTVVSRNKPYVLALLSHYQIDNDCLSDPGKGLLGLFFEWLRRTRLIIKLHRRTGFDVAIGTSVSISYLTLFFGVKSINVQEDDDSVIPLHVALAYPFSSLIMNPKCLQYRFFKNKRYIHGSLHEMAYLAPEDFQRETAVVQKYGLEPYNYILIRKVSLSAHHDIGAQGLSNNHVSFVNDVYPSVPTVSSDELKKSEVGFQDMHQVLAHARLVVTDSQTMTAEAACLGVPVIRVNSFVGKLSYLDELEELGLAYACLPHEHQKFKALLLDLAQDDSFVERVNKARCRVVEKYGNFNDDLLRAVEESQ